MLRPGPTKRPSSVPSRRLPLPQGNSSARWSQRRNRAVARRRQRRPGSGPRPGSDRGRDRDDASAGPRRIMKPRVTLITLAVDDLERSVAFYRDGLGLETKGIIGTEFEHGAVA